ncbi:MAG: hypothetical protein PHG55_07920, partial [Verrucomicrobiota bacterium]|nr:hypothetical protein [Verrucomicrobiota bacterium]
MAEDVEPADGGKWVIVGWRVRLVFGLKWQQRVEAGKWSGGGVAEDVEPADGERKVRTMIDRSWPPWERRR